MTDLRDQLATCHPGRRRKARGLCPGCYEHHLHAGTLDAFPITRKYRDEVIGRYTELRAQGRSVRYIAQRLGITVGALNKHYYRAVSAGDLEPDRRRTE